MIFFTLSTHSTLIKMKFVTTFPTLTLLISFFIFIQFCSIAICDRSFVRTIDNELIDFCEFEKKWNYEQIESIFLTASSKTCSGKEDFMIKSNNSKFIHCQKVKSHFSYNLFSCVFDNQNESIPYILTTKTNSGDFILVPYNALFAPVVFIGLIIFIYLIFVCVILSHPKSKTITKSQKSQQITEKCKDINKCFTDFVCKTKDYVGLIDLDSFVDKLSLDEKKKFYAWALEFNKLNIVVYLEKQCSHICDLVEESELKKLFKNQCYLVLKHLMLNKSCQTKIRNVFDYRFIVYLLKHRKTESLKIGFPLLTKEFINGTFKQNRKETTLMGYFCSVMSQNSPTDMEIFHLMIDLGAQEPKDLDKFSIYTYLSFVVQKWKSV